MRRAISWIGEELDALEEFGRDYAGPLKAQILGPWTMAASIELAGGERVLKDAGACRDLAGALAEAVRVHVAELQRRFPLATIVLQVDEPGLNAVLEGSIGSVSGLSRFDPVDAPLAQDALREVLIAVPHLMSGVHCCATAPPIRVMTSAGAGFVSVDLTLPGIDEDAIGAAWESGIGIWAGSVRPLAQLERRGSDALVSAPMRTLAHHLGMDDAEHMASVVVTPACGCSGAQWAQVRAVYSACVRAGRVLRQEESVG